MSVNDFISFECYLKREINIPPVAHVSTSKNSEIYAKDTSCQVRTRKELSLREKLEILKQYDNLPKMSQRNAAVRLKISQPVLCKILKNRNFIENILQTNENSVRKRTRGGKEREIETALKMWYVEVQKKNIPINGQIIREKAKELAKQMGKEFAATDGWFTRWRKRENIVYNPLFRRKLKIEKQFDCFQYEPKDHSPQVDVTVCETSPTHNNTGVNKLSETPLKQNTTESLSGHCLVKIKAESKMPEMEESKDWELENENICEVFIKSEPVYDDDDDDDDYEFSNKSVVKSPTDEEMLEALRILTAGVKYRTSDLHLHNEYEQFIYQLLRRVV